MSIRLMVALYNLQLSDTAHMTLDTLQILIKQHFRQCIEKHATQSALTLLNLLT